MNSNAMSVSEIVDLMTGQVELICQKVLPGGKLDGQHYRAGSLAGGKGASLSVMLKGSKPGCWREFNGGVGGDILDLVSHAMFRGDKRQAVIWAKDFLGIDRADPDEMRAAIKRVEVEKRKAAEKDAKYKKSIRATCWRIWHAEAASDLTDTPVAAYLAGRGIVISDLPSVGSLHYHPALYHGEAKLKFHAMVAAVYSPAGRFQGIHRTFLELRDGRWLKAFPDNPRLAKMGLGRWTGGYISISKGKSGKPLGKAPDGDPVILCEGIEDALCLALDMPDPRVLACLSLSNIGALQLPDQIGTVTIFADNDDNDTARKGLDDAAAIQAARHRDVRLTFPPAQYKDANDYWQGKRIAR